MLTGRTPRTAALGGAAFSVLAPTAATGVLSGVSSVAGNQSMLKKTAYVSSSETSADSPVSARQPCVGRATVGGLISLAVLVAITLCPVFLHPYVQGVHSRPQDMVLWWTVGMSVTWLVGFHAAVRRPVRLHILLVPCYVAIAADLFLLLNFKSRLTSGYINIMLAEYKEFGEFLSGYGGSVLAVVVPVFAVYAIALRGIRNLRFCWPAWAKYAAAAVLLAGYAAPTVRQMRTEHMSLARAIHDVVAHDYSSPMSFLAQTYVAALVAVRTSDLLAERRAHSFGAVKPESDCAETYVLMIGESSRPDRWSSAGYARETAPRTAALSSFVRFNNVLSTGPLTSIAVPSMLSLVPINNWDGVRAQSSILTAFREAGFATWWLSTQEVSQWGGIVHAVAEEAGLRRYYDRSLDTVLIEQMRELLARRNRPRKLLVVLHTRGSHFDYAKRYPPEFRKFPQDADSRAEYVRNTYDNSILFSDHVLAEGIEVLKSLDGCTALLYASDHGENLLDDEQELLGHGFGNRYDLLTAMFFWYSDAFNARFPEKIAAAHAAAAVPLSLANVAHSMLHLADIQTDLVDLSMSIFGDQLQARRRYYYLRGELRRERLDRGAQE